MKLWLPILLLMFPRFASAQVDPAPAGQFVRQYAAHYPIVIVIFGFFYIIFYGSVLYIFGPIVIALMPLGGANRIAKSYVENIFVWNAWPILYGGFGALLSAVQMGQVGQMLNQNDFLGGLGNLEGSFLIGIVSIVYSLAIAVIPFIAKRIVSGDVGSTAAAMVGTAVTALTVGAAGIEGIAAGVASAGAGSSGGAAAGSSSSAATAGSARPLTASAGGNQPAPPQQPAIAAYSGSSGTGLQHGSPTLEGHADQIRSSMSDVTEAKSQGLSVDAVIHAKLDRLSELVNGYDFAQVIGTYWRAHTEGNQELKNCAIRWLRGEYTTRTEARTALGVRNIVDDASVYDQLKLMGIFVRLSGFSGLLVCLDELVNLYKLSNTQARRSNYEQLLRIVNDMLQGTTEGLGFILGGTPDFLMNTQRGLYSYSALQSRLAENAFAKSANVVDYDHPVLHLASLSQEEFLLLLGNILNVFASGDESRYLLSEEGLFAFMSHCHQRIGEAYFRTPRTTITAFVNLLSVLEQNPDMNWQNLLGQVEIIRDTGGSADLALDEVSVSDPSEVTVLTMPQSAPEDEFTSFKL